MGKLTSVTIALIIIKFTITIEILEASAKRIYTALKVKRIIITKNISTCQNSKNDALLIGSKYYSSFPNKVIKTAFGVIPKLLYFTKTSDTR